jgi:hypothetical protein
MNNEVGISNNNQDDFNKSQSLLSFCLKYALEYSF